MFRSFLIASSIGITVLSLNACRVGDKNSGSSIPPAPVVSETLVQPTLQQPTTPQPTANEQSMMPKPMMQQQPSSMSHCRLLFHRLTH